MEMGEKASMLALLAENALLGHLQRGLLAIDGEKNKWKGNKNKVTDLERLAEAASR